MGVLERFFWWVKFLGNLGVVAYLCSRVAVGEHTWYGLGFFIALGSHTAVEALHELVGDSLARRRESQRTWAIRWWARSRGLRPGGSFKVREIVPTKLVLVRR
jgi:hypothetical protein